MNENLPRTTLERVSSAMNSSNLKLKETACDLDAIMALGMATRRMPMASELISLHLGGSRAAFKDARKAAIKLTARLNLKRKWDITLRQDVVRIADAAMKMYLSPVCPECHGTKYEVVPGTPMLSATHCHKCHGTGRRNFPIKDGRKISEVVWVLCSIEDVAEDAIRKMLR